MRTPTGPRTHVLAWSLRSSWRGRRWRTTGPTLRPRAPVGSWASIPSAPWLATVRRPGNALRQ
eukprot:11222580-Lingulodinium_polyedra.AAC.1